MIQHLKFGQCGVHIDNDTGLAIAVVVKHYNVLQCFKLDAYNAPMGSTAGVAMANALKHHRVLQRFGLLACGTDMDDETGVAMACAQAQQGDPAF